MEFENVYIKVEVVKELSSDELDCVLSDSFKITENDSLVHINVGNRQTEGYPIQIDTVINLLTELKNSGANYVEIDYNVDHYEYEMCGLNIEPASKELINTYNNRNAEKRKLEAEYEELSNKAMELRNKMSKL